MIIENTGLKGLQTDLAHLDEVSEKLGFVRWQWEYYRATYDLKFMDGSNEYFLRVNTRAVEGKLENPETILVFEDVYMGKTSFPHGLDYEAAIPDSVVKAAQQKLAELKKLIEA